MTTTQTSRSVDTTDATNNKPNIVLIFAALMITMLLSSLSQTVLSSALPTIVGELHGVEQMTWVITAYMLASTVMMPVYGKLGDVIGRKPLIIAAIFTFVIGSVFGGIAQNMTFLIIGRVIQGLGGGGLMILSQAAIADVVPARERGKYVGILGGVFAFSSVAGPLLGGWLTEGPGWRWAFWLNIPLGLIAAAAVFMLLHLPEKAKSSTPPKHDYLGMAVLALATTFVVLIGTWGGSMYSWGSPQIIGLVVAAIVSIVVFILIEREASEPIMPLGMFKVRNFNLSTFSALLTSIVMFGAIGYIPTYFQMAGGYDATTAGLLMIPMMASLMTTSVIVGNLVSRTGRTKWFPVVGTLILTVGVAMLSTTTIDTPVYLICIALGVMGIGLGSSMQVLTLVVQNSFPHKMVGTATAGNNYFRQVGGSVGSAVVGSIFATRLATFVTERVPSGSGNPDGASSLTPDLVKSFPDEIRIPIVESYNEALMPIFVFMIPVAIVAAIVLLFVKEEPLATSIEVESTVVVDDARVKSAGAESAPDSTGRDLETTLNVARI